MPIPWRSARAKTLVQLYTKLWHSYEQRKCCRISRLKRLYHLLKVPSTRHLSLSSLSSKSTPSSQSVTTDSDSEDELEETTSLSEDSWAEVLGSDWQGQGFLGSDTSLASDDSDILSQGDNNSDSSLPGIAVMENQVSRVMGWRCQMMKMLKNLLGTVGRS